MIGFIKANPNALEKIIALLRAEGVNFIDHAKVDDCLTNTVMRRFNLRVWHEAIFLNGFYLDYFNSNRDVESLACSYHLPADECKAMIDHARFVHESIFAKEL